jgi:hypothetical protein
LQRSSRSRQLVVLIWFVVGFFVFPFTPPISHNLTLEQNVIGQSTETPAFTRMEQAPSKIVVIVLKPILVPWQDPMPDPFYTCLLVVFLFFLQSQIRELLKGRMLAPLKFTSIYVIFTHSILSAIYVNSAMKRGVIYEQYFGIKRTLTISA